MLKHTKESKKRFPLSHGETYKCTRTTTDKTRHIDIHIHIVINIQIHVQQHKFTLLDVGAANNKLRVLQHEKGK